MSQCYRFSRGINVQWLWSKTFFNHNSPPPCLRLPGNVLRKVSVCVVKRNQCIWETFSSCLQSCDTLDAAKNELWRQNLKGNLEKDLAYLFCREKKLRPRGKATCPNSWGRTDTRSHVSLFLTSSLQRKLRLFILFPSSKAKVCFRESRCHLLMGCGLGAEEWATGMHRRL